MKGSGAISSLVHLLSGNFISWNSDPIDIKICAAC